MKKAKELTEDQKARMIATLKRIRGGLRRVQKDQFEEPAHLFFPEAFNADK